MPDHIHMLEGIPSKIGMSSLVEYLKEKISLMIQEKYPELKYKYGNWKLWWRGYTWIRQKRMQKKIEEYIQKQQEEDKTVERLTLRNL